MQRHRHKEWISSPIEYTMEVAMPKRLAFLSVLSLVSGVTALCIAGWTEASAQHRRCRVADPSGTPLNVRTSPNGKVVGTLSNGTLVTVLDNSTSFGKMWAYVARAEDQLHLGWVFRDYLECGTWAGDLPLDGYAFQYNGESSNTVANFEQCVMSCRRAESCSAYVFFKSRRLCRLMTRSDAILERNSDAVSGYKVHPRTAALPSIQSPPIPGSENQNGSARLEIPLEEEGGALVVPVLINSALTLGFVIDSGASDVSLPADVVITLVRTGTLQDADFIGAKTYRLADGSTVPSQTFRIRSLTVGGRAIANVIGSIAPVQGALLLGQSFLSRFKSWSINNAKHILVLEW
jgi:predicted aspartyl protease